MTRPLLIALTLALAAPAHAGDADAAREVSLPAGASSADAMRRVNAGAGEACQIGKKRWTNIFHKGDSNNDSKLQAGELGALTGAINEYLRSPRVGKCRLVKVVTDGA
jgi:hypothetical protein